MDTDQKETKPQGLTALQKAYWDKIAKECNYMNVYAER